MGWKCQPRQTTADFLTSLTNPAERQTLPGFEDRVPRTPQEFESYWKRSPEYSELMGQIDGYFVDCETLNTKEVFHQAHVAKQSNHIRPSSPYRVSFLCKLSIWLGEILND